jgi:hypothetical protein
VQSGDSVEWQGLPGLRCWKVRRVRLVCLRRLRERLRASWVELLHFLWSWEKHELDRTGCDACAAGTFSRAFNECGGGVEKTPGKAARRPAQRARTGSLVLAGKTLLRLLRSRQGVVSRLHELPRVQSGDSVNWQSVCQTLAMRESTPSQAGLRAWIARVESLVAGTIDRTVLLASSTKKPILRQN